jgi:hypothetical protein
MKTRSLSCLVILVLLMGLASVSMGAEVSQGKCVHYTAGQSVTLEEYDLNISKESPYGEPTGAVVTFNVEKAIIGIPPEAGDVLRIAYDVKGTERVALKVMNVSKQDLRKK